MNILAIDTSTDYLSLAVMKNGKIVSSLHKKAAMKHSSILIPGIDKALAEARLKIKDIDVFVISQGPGSFTGLRIGVTTVKGFAYALKKKIVAIPTLDLIARNGVKFRGIVCPVLDARKDKVYACIYRSDGKKLKRISQYLLLSMEDLKKKLAPYDKIYLLGDMVEGKRWNPRAFEAAFMALEEIRNKRFVKPEDLEPLYIYSRECDIKGR